MAQVIQGGSPQLRFFARRVEVRTDARGKSTTGRRETPLCAGCRAREARYGFREHDDDPALERPRTLCFECFRMELTHRQDVAARLARGWNAAQAPLPLEDTLHALTRRRRRAQIAARHALDLR
jgi:hypothetical protein